MMNRYQRSRVREIEPLEQRLLLAIDVPSIVAQYNQGASAMRQVGEVSAALEQAFGVDLDLPMIRENVADLLKNANAAHDLTAPFKSVSVAANATMADLKQQLVAAGLSVEYASEVPDARGDVLRVRWQRGLNEPGTLNPGGPAGFAYLDPENDVQGSLSGNSLTVSAGAASVEFVFGIQAKGESPDFYVQAGGGLKFSGLSASGLVEGNLGIGYLLDVDASAILRADLTGELVLLDNDSDGRLRLPDLDSANELRAALDGNLSGSVTLEGSLKANIPLLGQGLEWGVSLGVDFKGSNAIPRDTKFTTVPSIGAFQDLVDDAVATVRENFDLFGGLGSIFGDNDSNVMPIPTFSEGETGQSLGELIGVPEDTSFQVVTPNINAAMISDLINGRRVDLVKIQAKGGDEYRFDPPPTTIAEIPFAIGPIPASVRLSVGYEVHAGYSYYAAIGIDTLGVYIHPRTNFTVYGGAEADLRGKLVLAGVLDTVELSAGVGLEIAGRVGIRDPDPSDGRIYVGELFQEVDGSYDLAEGLLNVMDVSLEGTAYAHAKATLKLPKIKIFGKTIGGDRTLFEKRVDLADFSVAVGEENKEYERPTEQEPRRPLPTRRGQSLDTDWFENGVLTLDSDALVGEEQPMSVNVRRLDNGRVEVNWFGVGKSDYANLTKIVFVGSNQDDWLYVSSDVVVEVDARGRGGDDYLSGGTARASLYGGDGDDELFGGSADDRIYGEAGNDYLWGGAGSDEFEGGAGHDQLFGDAGADTLRGDAGNDFLDGGADTDRLLGGNDDDALLGGEGDDLLFGGSGKDRLYGREGDDRLEGGAGDDNLLGGVGHDTMLGGGGDDKLLGEEGNDILWGDDPATSDTGDDMAWGGTGDDTIYGGLGADALFGDEGNDELRGGDAADELEGGLGDDKLFGERGNDRLRGGGGRDDLDGGENDDVLVIDFESGGQVAGGAYRGGSGRDSLEIAGTVSTLDENGNLLVDADGFLTGDDNVADWITLDQLAADRFRATKLVPGTGQLIASLDFTLDGSTAGDVEVLSIAGLGGDDVISVLPTVRKHVTLDGGNGNDTLTGGAGNDVLYGGLGDDLLEGGEGDDALYGGESGDDTDTGNDRLFGGVGNDVLYGMAGNDQLDGGEGRDVQEGGDGDDSVSAGGGLLGDVMDGGAGSDALEGGSGADVIRGGAGQDTISGAGGADVIEGGEGDDLLDGGRGRDVIIAGIGNDRLYAVDPTMFDGDPLEPPLGWLDHQAEALEKVQEFIDAQRPIVLNVISLNEELALLPPYSSATAEEAERREALEVEIARLNRLSEQLSNEKLATLNQAFADGDLNQTLSVDVLIGDAGDDHLFGSQFADTLNGGEGDDYLYFSDGNDVYTGGAGSDKLAFRGTEADDDILAYARPQSGGTGNLELRMTMNGLAVGGAAALPKGNDVEAIRIEALGGDDTVQLDFGLNAFALFEIDGGKGDDRLVAGLLNEWYENGAPYQWNVMMWGRVGNDFLLGGAGDDFLIGGDPLNHYRYGDESWFNDRYGEPNDGDLKGRDLVDGGAGNDWLTGGPGDDFVFGGSGRDILVAGAGNGNDFMAASTIYYRNPGNGALEPHPGGIPNQDGSEDILYGGAGDQFLFGDSADRDELDAAGSKTSRLFGHFGNDEVHRLEGQSWFVGDLTRTTIIDSTSGNLVHSLSGLPQAGHPFWAPIASAGGPYEIAEGQNLRLDAEYRRNINELYEYGAGTWMDFYYEHGEPKQVDGFRWSILVDGAERAIYEGEAPTLNWATLEALGVRGSETLVEVRLRVEDIMGRVGVSLATRVTIKNAAPTADLVAPSQVTTGVPFIVDLRPSDPSQSDRLAGFTWEIDWGNGQQTRLDNPTGAVELRHTYAQSGDFLVRAWARDQDGGTSVLAQQLVLARRIGGDVDGDERVNLSDFGVLKQHFGQSNRDVRHGDFNGDGRVDLSDFGILKQNFGKRSASDSVVASALRPQRGNDDLRQEAALHLAIAGLMDEDLG